VGGSGRATADIPPAHESQVPLDSFNLLCERGSLGAGDRELKRRPRGPRFSVCRARSCPGTWCTRRLRVRSYQSGLAAWMGRGPSRGSPPGRRASLDSSSWVTPRFRASMSCLHKLLSGRLARSSLDPGNRGLQRPRHDRPVNLCGGSGWVSRRAPLRRAPR